MTTMGIRHKGGWLVRAALALRRLRTDAALAASVYRERRRLAQLDDHALRDIGPSKLDAERESRRPIWDLPGERR